MVTFHIIINNLKFVPFKIIVPIELDGIRHDKVSVVLDFSNSIRKKKDSKAKMKTGS